MIKTSKTHLFLSIACIAGGALFGCGEAPGEIPASGLLAASSPQGVGGVLPGFAGLAQDVGFERFAHLMRTSGLDDELDRSVGSFTVLVPRVEAMDLFMDTNPEVREEQLVLVHALLAQHVILGPHLPSELATSTHRTYLPGVELTGRSSGDLMGVRGTAIEPTGRWWRAEKGYLVEVDAVLAPALSIEHELEQAGFHLMIEALTATGYDELQDWQMAATVLAPSDGAFLRVGLDQNGIHDPLARPRIWGIVRALVLEEAEPDDVFNDKLEALSGAFVRIDRVYLEDEGREREVVFYDGEASANLDDDRAATFGPRGAIVPIDRVIDPKK